MPAAGMYSKPIEDVIARLDYHTADVSGRILRGYKWEKKPIKEGETPDSFPSVRIFVPDVRENFKPRAQVAGQLDINIQVAVARDEGLVALMQAVEAVADALQTKIDGTIFALAGTVKPFDWRTEGNFVVDASLNAQLIITATPVVKAVGLRRV